MFTGKYFIEKLRMKPHEEGGYYAEYLKSKEIHDFSFINKDFEGNRMLWSSTYFLLKDRDTSVFHSIKSDEIWYYNSGTAVIIYIINEKGELHREKLGLDIDRGEQPMVLIPAGSIFAAEMDGTGYSLMTCMCSPGFDYADFSIAERSNLLEKYPAYETIIKRLTK